MIPVTKEMRDAFFLRIVVNGENFESALAAVLAVVERDHLESPPAVPRRCADCGRSARELIATQDAGGGVVHLGPGCSRKRLQKALQRAEALPIGGER